MTTNRLELSQKRFVHVRKNQNVFSMVSANIRELHLLGHTIQTKRITSSPSAKEKGKMHLNKSGYLNHIA